MGEQRANLVAVQHHRQPPWPLRADHAFEIGQRLLQHLPVEEHQRIQRLVLRRRRDPPLARQVAQERHDLRPPEPRRMPLPMEEDEAPDPVNVSLLRPRAVVPEPKLLPHPIQQLRAPRPSPLR